MRRTSLGLPLALCLSLCTGLAIDTPAAGPDRRQAADESPWQTAAEGPAGGLEFRITDENGDPLPCRLTFVPADDPEAAPELFGGVDAAPGQLALRGNVVYSLGGRGRITVPVGSYRVFATHGMEWSRAERLLTVESDENTFWNAALRHELETDGWVSGDFHLHTLTFSGHGDANLPERVISLIGEGVEFAVATDHNHNTDYGPTLADLGAGAHLTAVTGNEVSTPIGHFNAFPLAPDRPVIDAGQSDANKLFAMIRQEPSPQGPGHSGSTPIIQLNHPRWDGIDYFAKTGFDAVTGTSGSPSFSLDFDSIEVLNENPAWGYFEKYADGIDTSGNRHSVLRDWFHLLDRGHRAVAVGNSDSHSVHNTFAGYPRNLIYTGTDDPGSIDPGAVAAAIRSGQVVATTGPFLRVQSDVRPQGEFIPAKDGRVRLNIDVQCASWIACDRLKVVVNGDVVQTIKLAALDQREGPLHAVQSIELALKQDAWIVILAEGDTPLAPIVRSRGQRPALPLAIANPLWVDADGDGRWTTPMESARSDLSALEEKIGPAYQDGAATLTVAASLAALPPEAAARLILSAAETRSKLLEALVFGGLRSGQRRVQLAAARSLEQLGSGLFALPNTGVALEAEGLIQRTDDPYLAVALARALLSCELVSSPGELLIGLFERHGEATIRPYLEELEPLIPATPVVQWRAIGLFAAPQQGTVRTVHLGPEEQDISDTQMTVRGGTPRSWSDLEAAPDGYLNLARLARDNESTDNAFAYAQTWVHAPTEGEYLVALGTDDGGRVTLAGELFHEDLRRQRATPFQHVKSMPLSAGWNRVLFQVENGGGAFGLYFLLLDPALRSARRPQE